jgi:hypothetical protein
MPDATDLEEALLRLRAAWMAGQPALGHAPVAWREALGEGPTAETALAALAGQAVQTAFRPTGPGPLAPRPPLPRLPAPLAPMAARQRLRRVLAAKAEEGRSRALVQFFTARGFVMHPADWTPGPRDDWAPPIYAPWLAWAASERSPAPDDGLTAANYEDWPWAQRRAALETLRRVDPDAARTIVAARAGAEPAERRLKLIELLETGLSAADIPYLESLAGDRSDRVQAEARRLLARLGHGAADADMAAELAAMVELSRTGLIRRRHQLRFKPPKTQAQGKRRNELLQLVPIADLARALGVAESAFSEAPPEGEALAVLQFVGQAAETGSDALRHALLEQLLETGGSPDLVVRLGARLAPDVRAARLPAVMARETQPYFNTTLAFAGALGSAPQSALTASTGYHLLRSALKTSQSGSDSGRAGADAQLRVGLANLGLLLNADAAAALIQICTAGGIFASDPRLDLLHLNAALRPERPT